MNSKLRPMNTNHRSIPLRSGQALAVGRHGSSTLFLAEGEVLVQAPAQWLGDQVFQAPARRVTAPAALSAGEIASLVAIGAVKLHAQVAASPLEKLRAAWQAARLPLPVHAR